MISTNTIQKNRELNDISKIKGFTTYDENKLQLTKEYKNQIEINKIIITKFVCKEHLLALKENLIKNKLNISVKDTEEGIKLLKSKNLFQYIGLIAKKNNKELLPFPLLFRYYQILSNSEEEVFNNHYSSNVLIEKSEYDNQIYEVYKIIESVYFINKDKGNNEYNMYIYKTEDMSYSIKYNFIDIYCILFSLNNKEAIAELFNILNITVESVENLKNIYLNNIDILNKEIFKYKNLNKLIFKHIPIFIELMNIALIECYFYTENKSIGDIYLSQRYLAKKVKKSQSTIMPYINGFALLGFYDKKDVESTTTDSFINECTIFTISNITEELLQKAEIVAQILNENKISLSNIKYKNISRVFGNEISLKIIKDKKTIRGKYDKICS